MPGINGIDATERITALRDPPKVIVLTIFQLDEYVFGALRAGQAASCSRTRRGLTSSTRYD
jgi:DNA-binding NarL/FixJ family response regulator